MPKELRGYVVQLGGVLVACWAAVAVSLPAAGAVLLASTALALVLYYDR